GQRRVPGHSRGRRFSPVPGAASRVGATPSLLAEWLDTHPATMTNRLDRLEQAGYVDRVHDPGDRRRLLVALTPAGRAIWQERMDDSGLEEQDLLAPLDPGDRELLDDLLRRMVRAAEAGGPPLMPGWPSGPDAENRMSNRGTGG
ncbi:MarR family winged helix-turn-helix transcriptional regulator, partial [Streptosporangium sp. NPDC001682]